MGDTDFLTWRKVNEPKVSVLEGAVTRLTSIVTGNGKPGLDEQVRTIGKQVTGVEDRLGTLEGEIRKLVLAAVFAGVAACGAIVWQVVVWAIKQGGVGS